MRCFPGEQSASGSRPERRAKGPAESLAPARALSPRAGCRMAAQPVRRPGARAAEETCRMIPLTSSARHSLCSRMAWRSVRPIRRISRSGAAAAGRYSHWEGNWLLFSTSDTTDPSTRTDANTASPGRSRIEHGRCRPSSVLPTRHSQVSPRNESPAAAAHLFPAHIARVSNARKAAGPMCPARA